MKKKINLSLVLLIAGASIVMVSCGKKQKSSITGWNYNDKKNGGFQVFDNVEQTTGPGLVLIEGGTFVMGSLEQDLTRDMDNMERRVTVASFYMDESEVSNKNWLEYVYWVNRVFGKDYPEVVKNSLPDTLVWRNRLGSNRNHVG